MRRLRFLLATAALLAALPGPAAAAPAPGDLLVTYVARVCDRYDQVMANKARNNVQESLRDLGPDSNYTRTESVGAAKEAAGTPLPPCRPLPGWTFSTGRGFFGRSPATQNLSTVAAPLRQNVTTAASAPELDAAGNPTGRTLEGAVTVALTSAERSAAQDGNLVAQGGTKAQPLNGLQDTYGFAALRCAQDSVNGDNVEYLSYPSGTRHVFCYYYAVTPPPGAGTITVVKRVADGSNGEGAFRFDGNLSYADSNGDGVNDFVLNASSTKSSSMDFVRGETRPGDPPWTFQEHVDPDSGWAPPGFPSCTAVGADGGPGTSALGADSTGRATVSLVAGDHVTCTYTNRREAGASLLEKESIGGTGTFDVSLTPPPDTDVVVVSPVTTTAEGTPVAVASAAHPSPGHYALAEAVPAPGPTGYWDTPTAYCNGTELPVTTGPATGSAPYGTWNARYDLPVADETHCLLTNRFVPGGRITVEKTTVGGTGTFDYLITPHPVGRAAGPDAPTHRSTATTTAENTPVTAAPAAERLRVTGEVHYIVQEVMPPPTADGWWELESADCGPNTGPVDRVRAVTDVTLTPEEPTPTCRFTNRFHHVTRLDLVKLTTGDTGLRPLAARLELRCTGDESPAALLVDPGRERGDLPRRTFTTATACTLTEPASGAADGIDTATGAVLRTDDGTEQAVEFGREFTVPAERTSILTVTNRLTRPSPSPSPSPSASPSPTPSASSPAPPPPSPPAGSLPDTGGSPLPLLGAVGAAVLLTAGTVLLAGARRRRH
ncbi:prealbumin-like fold domain-containing protein [Kitasatospora sp. NPDC004272]